jgi:hypothetical protein
MASPIAAPMLQINIIWAKKPFGSEITLKNAKK